MLSKKCIQCNKEFSKPINRSVKDFTERAKYCSKDCMNVFRCGKPSPSPATTFKKGQIVFVPPESRLRGEKNHKWKGGQVSITCKVCRMDYKVDPYRAKTSKTCSTICNKKWKQTPEYCLALSKVHRERVKLGLHNFYRGATELNKLLRQTAEYRIWRKSVFERDAYKCQFCGIGGKLNADHIKSFAVILAENNLKTLDDALNCNELWNVENGRTLCVPCHKTTETYGLRTLAFINKRIEITIK